MSLSLENPAVARKVAVGGGFEELFAGNYAALARMIYRVVGDTGWAEELAAEAFWKLYRNPPRSADNLAGWLRRTGLRLALDGLRKRKRRSHYEGLATLQREAQNPAQEFEKAEQQDRVRAALAAIRPERAALLVLRSEGYSLSEIAGTLGLNPNSVGKFLARADEAFRKEYVKRYGEQ